MSGLRFLGFDGQRSEALEPSRALGLRSRSGQEVVDFRGSLWPDG